MLSLFHSNPPPCAASLWLDCLVYLWHTPGVALTVRGCEPYLLRVLPGQGTAVLRVAEQGQHAHAHADSSANGSEASGDRLNMPLATLSALLSLSIPPPASSADLPRVVEDLKTKKAWFEANQARVTAENKAKAEKEIERLIGKANKVDVPAADDVTPPNGGGELPAEPAPTPAVTDKVSEPVPEDEVVEKLEVVEENGTAEAAEES